MTDSSPSNVLAPMADGSEKRRGTRLMVEVAITVTGMDPLGEPFREETITTGVSCYGCKYRTRRYAAKDTVVILEIPRTDTPLSPRIVHARVVWVQRPRHHRETFQIGLELEMPGNVWGIDAPPADWFPHPDDLRARRVEERPPALAEKLAVSEITEPPSVLLGAPPAVLPKQAVAPEWETVHLPEAQPFAAHANERQGKAEAAEVRALLSETVKATTDAMIAEEIALMRKHFTGRLESALVETLKTFSELTTEIVKETREACRASVKEMEAGAQKFAHEAQATIAQGRANNEHTAPVPGQATPVRAAAARKTSSGKRRKKAPESTKE